MELLVVVEDSFCMLNLFVLKVVSMLFFLIASVVINFFLLYPNKKISKNKKELKKTKKRKDEQYFNICVLIIIGLNIIFYLLDCFIFKNEFTDYVAFNMLLSFLLSVTFEDMKTKFMDTRVILGYFILFLIYRIVFLDLKIFLEGFAGFAFSLFIMLLAYFIKRKSIGIGDIEVIAACGMIIGFPNIFHFLFKAFLFVFIFGLILIIRKKKNLLTELPLAPFLLAATII